MRYAIEHLRAKGMRVIFYLDDICILDKSKSQMKKSVQILTQHLEQLVFLINMKKVCSNRKRPKNS